MNGPKIPGQVMAMKPIVERRLLFTPKSGGEQLSLKVAIGAPYFPARSQHVDKFSACLVHTGTESAGEHEVYGVDKVQALANALMAIDFFLMGLAAAGAVTWDDGKPCNAASRKAFINDIRQKIIPTGGIDEKELDRNVDRFVKAYGSVKRRK